MANQVESALNAENIDLEQLDISFSLLSERWRKLDLCDNEVIDFMSGNETDELVFTEEYEKIYSYSDKFIELKTKVERTRKALDKKICDSSSLPTPTPEAENKRKIKLPTIELKKYDGSIKDWLGFWNIFKKIHEDPELSDEDKFVYLIQSTSEKSRARDLVESFPPTAKNYPLVIDCLKSRFGRDELLIEVYVRELLNIVLNHNKSNVVKLYDKIEAYLRALDSLGVCSDKCSAMLYPLVESCLSEDVLKLWERHVSSLLAQASEKGAINKLSALMEFLKAEVEGEQRLAIAKNTFNREGESKKINKRVFSENKSDVPTAAALLDVKGNSHKRCIFCERQHNPNECHKAKKMSIDEKREIAKKNGCCFLCLKRGHRSKQCTSRTKCILCSKSHSIVMCPNLTADTKIENFKPKEQVNSTEPKDSTLTTQCTTAGVLLQTLQVYLRGEQSRYVVRALIDSGSQRSYISSKAAKLLNYESLGDISITHSLFGGVESPRQKHRRLRVYLTSLDESYKCNFEVLEQKKICGDIIQVPKGPWVEDLQRKGIVLTDSESHSISSDPDIHLLIGADVAGKLLNGKMEKLPSGLVVIGTHLGWTLMGRIPQGSEVSESYLSVISLLSKDINLPDMWNLDRIGITDPSESQTKEELNKIAYEQFVHNLKIDVEGRYEVALPWLKERPSLQEHKDIAERRLLKTIQKLRSANLLQSYQDVLRTWLRDNIIEEVKPEDAVKPGHYLPHRAVIKDSSTTRIRPVFDASARSKSSPSLNDCLSKGPNMLELVPAILTRFRMKQFAVTSDIKQAFLQISISEKDRDYLRFLWMEDGVPEKMKIYRHRRVVFGLTSSPFLLSATLRHHLDNAPTSLRNTAAILKDSFYVDNCLASFDTAEQCENFVHQSKSLLLSGKFDLRGWRGNSLTFESDQSQSLTECNLEDHSGKLNFISVLGLIWDISRDVLICSTTFLANLDVSAKLTKRRILAIAQQIYDPLGFTSPCTLLPKLLLQECWKLKIPWDKELPDDLKKKFLNWQNQLNSLKDVQIPRWMMKETSTLTHCSLHVFADASGYAYATCVFLRLETNESVSCHFVRAKSRITPLKEITIPRLELLACLIAVRLAASIKKDMKMPEMETHYWTDSSNALSWIKRDEQWAIFITNRVKEIRSLSPIDRWHHIPGNLNPADLPSRGCSVRHLIETKWIEGPDWLKSPINEWPKSRIEVDEESLNKERRKIAVTSLEKDIPWYNRFSSYLKIVRIIAWMKRFLMNARKIKEERNFLNLTVEEIEQGEIVLLRLVQQEVFMKITNPILKPLRPYVDEKGLIRVTTRLTQRQDTFDFKCPIVLPSKHPVVHMLIGERHRRLCHAGVQTLMAQLRENYWILQCRKTIRSVLRNCKRCRRFEAARAEVMPAPLPENRIKNAAVFEVTGIDLGGPLYLRNGEKAWFVLFTCAVIRAVHIELVQSLSTEVFLLAFRRFVSRRGRPSYVYSDNATNFTGTNNILSAIDWSKVEEMASIERIQWNFIPPTAAWWGGWWERLIGMIKRLLRRVLGAAKLTFQELATVLCEVENVINCRPLTYMSEDVEDLIPLTPSLFLQEIRIGSVPEIDVFDSTHLNKRFRHRQKLRDDLTRRFRLEYLGQLKNPISKHPTTLRLGQVVLIGSDQVKRLDWPMAKILELYPGKDGKTRVARLKTKNGELIRPLQRLYPLEVEDSQRDSFLEGPSRGKRESPDKSSDNNFSCDGRKSSDNHPSLDDEESSEVKLSCDRNERPVVPVDLAGRPVVPEDLPDRPVVPEDPPDRLVKPPEDTVIKTKRGRVVKPRKRLDL